MTVDSIQLWAIFIFARRLDNRPEAGNSEVSPGLSNSEIIVASSTIQIRLLGSWIFTRYGYHCSLLFLFITSFLLVWNISFPFNKVRPGKRSNVECVC